MTTQALHAYWHWLKDRGLAYPAASAAEADRITPVNQPESGRRYRLMFVGDFATIEANDLHQPLCGEEEALLNRMIQAMKLPLADVLVVNAVDQQTSVRNQHHPDQASIAAGRDRVRQQVQQAECPIVITLGALATKFLLGDAAELSQIHGQPTPCSVLGGITVIPTFHPRDLLRQPSTKRLAWGDLQVAMRHMGLMVETNA